MKKTKTKKVSKKSVRKSKFVPSKADLAKLRKDAEAIVRKPNIKKYEFSVDKVYKMLKYIFVENGGKFSVRDSYKFAAGYCDKCDTNYREVNAIMSLMRKYRPNEMVVSTLAKGKKILIVGDVAEELLKKSEIIWTESHVSSAGAKIPIKLPIKKKLKAFCGNTIESEINKGR